MGKAEVLMHDEEGGTHKKSKKRGERYRLSRGWASIAAWEATLKSLPAIALEGRGKKVRR